MRVGRDAVYDALRAVGVDHLFGVPGTNEIPIIDGTNVSSNGVTYVPCLHENIAMGAAMGYARATGRPGVLELHVTPGAAHGIGNLYNAYRCRVPIVVLCAQQHSELLLQEPVLSSDLVQVARQYTKWAYEVRTPDELPTALQRAFKEALTAPARPVFLSIPWDFTLAPVPAGPDAITRVSTSSTGDPAAVEQAAARLAGARSPVIVAGDGVGAAGAWEDVQRLAQLLGAPVYTESLSSYMNYPNHLPEWQGELPQTQETMQQTLGGHDVAFLCGYNAQAQVFVFRQSLGPLIPPSVTQVYLHDDAWEIGKNGYGEVAILADIGATLPRLCDAVAAHRDHDADAAASRAEHLATLASARGDALDAHADALTSADASELPSGTEVAIALGSLQQQLPAPMTLVNESVSDGPALQKYVHYDRPDAYFFAQGGSLGYSMPASIGMKLGLGASRTVVNCVGDGSALFYPNTWWTAARHAAPVLTIVTNNREYRTLRLGLAGIGQIYDWTPAGDDWYLRLDQPPLVSYVDLAAAFGVGGSLVSSRDGLLDGLRAGFAAVAEGRSHVLEILTDPALKDPMPRLDALVASQEATDRAHPRLEHLGPV